MASKFSFAQIVTAMSSLLCVTSAATFVSVAQSLPLSLVNVTGLLIPDVGWSREYHLSKMLTITCPHPPCLYVGKTSHRLDTHVFLKHFILLVQLPQRTRGIHFFFSRWLNVVEYRESSVLQLHLKIISLILTWDIWRVFWRDFLTSDFFEQMGPTKNTVVRWSQWERSHRL